MNRFGGGLEVPLGARNGELRRVALLLDMNTPFGRDVLPGIADYGRRHGPWMFDLIRTHKGEELRRLRGWRGDGFIAQIFVAEQARALQSKGVPVVNLSGHVWPGIPMVKTDRLRVGRMAADYFISRGLTHLAHCGPATHPGAREHAAAMAELARQAGASFERCELLYETPISELERKLGKWAAGLAKPVGVFAFTSFGERLIAACHTRGIRVPEEVAVVGLYDDTSVCEFTNPPMSNLILPAERIGFEAAKLLDLMIGGMPAPAGPLLIEPTGIITRQSSDLLAVADAEIAHAVRYIWENVERKLTVGELSRAVQISRRSLEQRFRNLLGRSPGEEIRRNQIERARQLLLETDLPLPDVAERCGFRDAAYLGRQFKAQTGMTAIAFRRQFRV